MVEVPREVSREDLELRAFKAAQINEALAALSQTEGWKTLIETFTAAREQYYAQLSRNLMRGREVDQRTLDYNRGKFDGIQDLLEQPGKAKAVLENSLRRLSTAPEEKE